MDNRHFIKRALLAVFSFSVAALAFSGGPSAQDHHGGTVSVDFAKDIRPILEKHCFQCHGPALQMNGLRLDVSEAALKGGVSAPAILPGRSGESLLVRRISAPADSKLIMPPVGDPLPQEEIDLITAWIDQGAPWSEQGATASPPPPAGEPQQAVEIPVINRKVDFAREVFPILERSCFSCHGAETQNAQLRLDARKIVLQGGVSGPAVVPGRAEESLLFLRIAGLTEQPQMPLVGEKLSPQEIALVRGWIDQGAEWPEGLGAVVEEIAKHWAYVKPIRPELPEVSIPSWIRNPIDRFVLARLDKEGLQPSPEADRATLIRRVSLDLAGLPPSVAEVDAFLVDTRPDAYERLVDRLLASPHYGERWTFHWLDLARYADTNGYEKDRPRSLWPYRDWVVKAFNQNMPFDQFTIEQIAGDLLPHATREQKVATGFHRNTMINDEGGVDHEEFRVAAVLDRVNTTGTVWLGTTLECAQCHNHKYDPITQKEYYQFYAFFNKTVPDVETDEFNLRLLGLGGEIEVPTPEQEAKRQRWLDEIARLEERLRTSTADLESAQRRWEQEMRADRHQPEWVRLDPVQSFASSGVTLTELEDHSILVSGTESDRDLYSIGVKTDLRGITALKLEVLPHEDLPQGGPGRGPKGAFILTGFEVEILPAQDKGTIFDASRDPQKVHFATALADQAGKGYRVRGALDGRSETGWGVRIGPAGEPGHHEAVFVAESLLDSSSETRLRIRLQQESPLEHHQIGRFSLWVTTDPNPGIELVRPILASSPAERSDVQSEDLVAYFRSITPLLEPARERLAELRRDLWNLDIPTTLTMEEMKEPRPTHVLIRGNYLSPGERVEPGVPAVLHPFPKDQPAHRLGLARWLVDRDNPLTARVTMNRIWAEYFGRGIVETLEDFGTRSEPPTHPQLLDWLATEFMQDWDLKRMHRLIVTSATYRESSRVTPDLLKQDPYNSLLTRGPRFRVPVEMIRDIALAVGGLLNLEIGGPSVFPPQPEGILDDSFSFFDLMARWETSEGSDRYRRGLYTFWRRTAPYPAFLTFDFPRRDVCTVSRSRTNTPLQALTTLNDPAFVEPAIGLAQRMMTEAPGAIRDQLTYGLRLCVARHAKEDELDSLVDLYEKALHKFKKNPSSARALVFSGELDPPADLDLVRLAALTVVSNVLLNMDETITKG
ncbi:MAG: DUF1549 domain-containing protein [Acidobacteriota bacterium]